MKKLIFLVVPLFFWIAFLASASSASAEDFSPKIDKFEIRLADQRTAKLSFNFTRVKGGLARAEFSIGYEVDRNGSVLETGRVDGLKFSPAEVQVKILTLSPAGEDGEVSALLPVEETIRPGDKLRYFIYLRDGEGKKSNTVFYEFVFVDIQII